MSRRCFHGHQASAGLQDFAEKVLGHLVGFRSAACFQAGIMDALNLHSCAGTAAPLSCASFEEQLEVILRRSTVSNKTRC